MGDAGSRPRQHPRRGLAELCLVMEEDSSSMMVMKCDVQEWIWLSRKEVGSGGRCRLKSPSSPHQQPRQKLEEVCLEMKHGSFGDVDEV